MKKSTALSTVIILLLIALAFSILFIYYTAFTPNINTNKQNKICFYVHTGWTFEQTYKSLVKHNLLKHPKTFLITSKLKRFHKPRPGCYVLTADMNNNTLINKLRAGLQTPVKVTFNLIRTKQQLAGIISHQLEADSATLISLLNDPHYLKQYGFTPENVLAMFIPNTYEFYWNTSAQGFINRMYKEYKKFWTPRRLKKAQEIGLSPIEVTILASIVQAEQMRHPDEWPRIAGLYINRLHKGIPLQSDPTLIYALGDFSIRRVYNFHKKINSPYNTYIHKGLPPGPILTPQPQAIDAVLNYEHNNYLYMVAKADFSGYHHFSTNLKEHLYYARLYQKALNSRGIK